MAEGYKSILGQLLFEEKPVLPGLEAIDLGTEQLKSIKGNAAALPSLESLATKVNEFSQSERLKALRNVIPGLDASIADVMKNIQSGLKGEIPEDVSDAVQNSAAARSAAGGYAGSGMSRNLLARDLGLTSLDITNKSLDSFNRWLQVGSTYLTGPQMDVTAAFISPMQQAQFDVQERNTMWNYNWFKNQLDAQPEPWEKAVEGLMDWVANTGLTIAESYIGAATGGMGMMGGGGGGAGAGAGGGGAGVAGGTNVGGSLGGWDLKQLR